MSEGAAAVEVEGDVDGAPGLLWFGTAGADKSDTGTSICAVMKVEHSCQ